MIEKYLTANFSKWTKITIKNSRFFSRIYHVKSRKQVDKFLEKTVEKYNKATHIVYAFRIIEEDKLIEYSTDAGEPANSSGPPILTVIKGDELLNVCIFVVRYFGRKKLGIGGLIKAYTKAAQNAIENAQILTKINFEIVEINTDYKRIGKNINKIEKSGGSVEKIKYRKNIIIYAKIPVSKIAELNFS